jgi:branched-chain amino acid transport system substrate-binding protein
MTLSVQIEAERAEIPLLTTSYADQIVERGMKYTFKIPPLGSTVTALSMQYVSEMFRELKGAPPRRVAFFAGSDSASQSVIRAAPDLARQFNFEIVSSVSFQAGLTDATPIVSAVLRGRPEVIFLSSFSADVILGTRAIRGVGVTAPIITAGGGISTDTTGAALGAAADNLMGVVCWNWDLPLPGVSQVVDAFRAANPRAPFPPASETLGTGYSIGLIIRDALERAASADPKKVRDAVAQGEFAVPMPGGKVAFAENGQNRAIVPIMVGWQGGQLRTVWPKAVQAVQPRL